MACKYREEIVGKRFLSVSAYSNLKLDKISEWGWRAGVIRAATHKDNTQKDLQVLVEYDDVEWHRREWISLYKDSIFHMFLVEHGLVWGHRSDPFSNSSAAVLWPALTFTALVSTVDLSHNQQPLEFLLDKELSFCDHKQLKPFQEWDVTLPGIRDYLELRAAARRWTEQQDGQRILLATPSVLVGYRVEVYRAEGTTQWYTAVIVGYNEATRELTVTDDTVLEEHNEDPTLVQMRLIGDGVVESIMRGENVGITARRSRSAVLQAQHQQPGRVVRVTTSSAVNARKPRIGKPTLVSDPVLQTSPEAPDKAIVTTKPIRKRKSSENEPSCQSAGVVATLRLRSTPHYNNNSPSSIKEDLENNKLQHQSRSRKASSASIVAVASNNTAGNNSCHQHPLRNKKKLLEETNSSKIRNLHVRVEDCLQIAARSEALSAICRRNSEEKSADCSSLSSTTLAASFTTLSTSPTYTVFAHSDNPTLTTPSTQIEELSPQAEEGSATEDEPTIVVSRTNLHDSNNSSNSSTSSSSNPSTPLPTLTTLTPPPTVDVIELADSASSCDTANCCSGGGGGGESTAIHLISNTTNGNHAVLDAELLAVAGVTTTSDADVDDSDHDANGAFKSVITEWKPLVVCAEDVDKRSRHDGATATAATITVASQLHTVKSKEDCTVVVSATASEAALTAVTALVDVTPVIDSATVVEAISSGGANSDCSSNNATVVEERAATATATAATPAASNVVSVDVTVDEAAVAVTKCEGAGTDGGGAGSAAGVVDSTVVTGASTVTITTRPLRTSEPCGGHPVVVDDERPATPLLQQLYSSTGNTGRMETSSVGSVGSVGSDCGGSTAVGNSAAATAAGTSSATASPAPPLTNSGTNSSGSNESLLRFVVAGSGSNNSSNGGSDDRSDSGVSSLRSGSSGDERSGSRSSALSSSGDDLMAQQQQQQQQQQTVSQQPHQREQGGGVVQGGGRTSRSPVFAHTSVSGTREEPTVRVWRDPTLENEPHIRHIHSIQHQQMKLNQSIDQSRKHIHHSLLMSHPSTNAAAIAAAAAAGVNVSVTSNNGVPSIPSNLPLSLSTSSNSVMGGSGNAAAVTVSSTLSAATAAVAQQHLYNPIVLPPSGITTHPGLVPSSAPPMASSSAAAIYAAELMSWKQHHAAAIAASRGAAWAPPPSITSASAAVTTVVEEERRLLVERDRERERVYQERERLLREQQSDRMRDLQAKDQQQQQQQQQREREHRDKQEHLHHSQHLQLHHQQQRERYEHERQLRHEQQQRDREREHLILRQKDQQQQERERQKAQDSVDMVDQHFKESLKRAQHKSSSSAWPLMSIHPSSASSASVAQQQQHRNAVNVAAAVAADDERKRHEIEMFEHMQRVDQQRAAAAAAAAVADQQQQRHHHHHHLSTPANQVNQQRIEPSARYYTSSTGVTQRPASVPTSGGKAPHSASEYHPPPAHSRSSGNVGGNKITLDKQQSAHPTSVYHHPHAHHPSSQSQHKSSSELTAAAAAALHGYPTYQPTTFFATTASAAAGRDHHIGHHSSGNSGGAGHHKGLTLQQHGVLKDHSCLTSSLSPSMMTVAAAAAEQKNSVIVKHEKNLSGSSHHIEARGGNSIAHSPGPPKMSPLGGHYLPGGPQAQSHKLYEYRSPTQSPHHLTPSPHHLSGESKGHHRSPSGVPLSSPHHAHHPPPPSQQPSHHPSHHSLHPSTQPSPQQQQPPHHRQSPHGLSPGLVSSQQQQQQHSAHGGNRYRTNSEPAIHQSQHVQHYIQQQQQLQRERERDREREEQRRPAYTSYPPPSALSGASGSIYAPPTDHRLSAGSLISSAPSAITTPPTTTGSSTVKPKVSSPAPHQIFGKPSLTPPGSSSGGNAPSPIPLTASKGHHLAASPSPYQQMQPYSLSHNQGLGVAPPPAHSSRDVGSNRYLYERGYPPAPSAKPSIQHVTGVVPLAIISQPPLPSSGPLPTRHHHSHISAQQQLPPVLTQTQQQLSSIHHMPHHLHRHVVNHPQLAQQQQQPQYVQQPATHAVQTHPLDLGMSSSASGRCEQMSLSPKRKYVGPPSNNAPVCLEVKKRRMELTNNTINNSSSTISPLPCVSTNIYHPHDPHGQGQPHLTSPQPTAVLSRVSEPTPLLSTAAATTITTVVNASLYNHPSTVNATINLSTNTGRTPVSVAMLPRSPGALSTVLPDVSVTAVGITIAENKDSEDGSTGALPLLSTAYASDNEVKHSVMFSQPVNLTPPPTTTTPTQVNVLTPPTFIKTEPDVIVKTEPGLTIKTESDLTLKTESGHTVKNEFGHAVKIESGLTVKSEPGLTVKTELGIVIDTDRTIRSTSSPLPSAPMPSTILLSSSTASAHNNTGNYPVRHLKKAWLQRHTTGEHVDRSESSHSSTFLYGSCSSGNSTAASITTASTTILTVTREPGMVNSLHNIGSMAVNSINKSKHFQSKSNNRSLVRRKGTKDSSSLNGDISKDDSSSSDQERGRKSPPKRKPPKVKRRKGMVGRRPGDKKASKTGGGGGGGSTGGGSSVLGSESGSDSDKDTCSDKDSDSGASTTPLKKSNNGNSASTPPISLNLSANCMLKDTKSQEPRKRGRRPKTKNDKGEEPRIKKSKDQITENFRDTVGSEDNHASSAAAAEAAVAATTAAIAASTLSTIGALTFSSSNAATGGVAAPPRDPFRKPPIGQLKKTGETFLQDGPCFEVAPKLAKCRECRWTPNQRSKNMPNIFCRFYAFRRLRYTKNGQLAIAGFSDPHTDAYEDDIKLWLPSSDTPPADLNMETSRFILRQVGDHFCNLLVQEKDAYREHMSDDKTIAWKRVVQGVREMCDVCETTLFNFHWACGKCGFVVCLDCYKGRKRDIIKIWYDTGRDRDEYSWLLCTNRSAHEQDRLMLTQIIAGDSLNKLGKLMHEMREMWHVDQYCNCAMSKEISLAAMKTNGIRKEMIRGFIRMELNGMKREVKEEPVPPQQNGQKEGWSIGPEMTSPSNDDKKNDDSDSEGSYSHLRELLTSSSNRPKQPNGSRAESPTSTQSFPPPSVPHIKKKSKLDSVDEVIFSVIEESIPRPDLHYNNPFADPRELRHYIPRDNAEIKYRGLLPVRVLTLTESKVLYPGIPHNWLCHGKLLRLSDSTNPGNYRIFQDQWKRGQPVLISDVTKHMDRSLWTPDSFASDFGEEKNDLVNCLSGSIVTNQPMRKFWEGFENPSKRLKDDSGNPMLLKLKDWPPAEDFAEMLPSRFSDLMKVLPLPDYTHRSGRLNLAGHLPDCFVRPDLGPKMYTAYGSALHPSKGTTNLHLDISDAVNVMVYVGIPKDGNNDEHIKEAFRAIDDAGCDILTKRRIRDKGELPGALWHIYNSRDADKIRDLLNKMVVESGGSLKPNHDPIHDQSRYLDGALRERLYKEYGVEGYAIVQCLGDAVFIPAGAPHQVRNLHNCIKVAEDFVSPENVSQCFHLTQEFRELTHAHTNHEDKLQIKNIIYHAVKDSLSTLSSILNKHLSADNSIGCNTTNTTDIKTEIKSEVD